MRRATVRRFHPGIWLAAVMGVFVGAMTVLAYSGGQADAGVAVVDAESRVRRVGGFRGHFVLG